MLSKDAFPSMVRLEATFLQIVQQARTLCDGLERGQAECPLTAALDGLLLESSDPWLKISLLFGSLTARDAAVAWLGGEAAHGRGHAAIDVETSDSGKTRLFVPESSEALSA